MVKLLERWRAWLRPKGSLPQAVAETPQDELDLALADGELLARHAVRLKLAVPAADLVLLTTARAEPVATQRDAGWRTRHVQAQQQLLAAGVPPVAEVRALESRLQRLRPELQHAHRLLMFAAARGRAVDDALAQPLLAAVAAADAASITAEQEQAFLVAYRRLAAEMAPVSGATLAASEQRIPRPGDLIAQPRRFFEDLLAITLGRFMHFTLFTLVLVGAGATIAYQTVGEAAFARHGDTGQRLQALAQEQARAKVVERERQHALYQLTEQRNPRGDELAQADLRLREAVAEVERLDRARDALQAERDTLTTMLKLWTGQPCRSPYMRWICGFSLTTDGRVAVDSEIVFDAEMALKRLNQIILPMLLGLLGAYSFVLRTLSREIRERSFEEHSALHHVARLSLGALAGIAIGWLLKPEQIGLLASVPTWVMAFVAGYGIELVFAFMDRIVGAFTQKNAGGQR